ncbi:MAG: hypothetical protein ABSD11_16890 [Methylocella sp.]|jgi:hypothetical protein
MRSIHCRRVDKAAGTSFGKLGAFEIDANLDAAIGGTCERLHDRPVGWDIGGYGRDIPWGKALEILLISVRLAGWRWFFLQLIDFIGALFSP